MGCVGCSGAPSQDGSQSLGDVLDGLTQAPLANPGTSGNPGANVGTQLGVMASGATFKAAEPNSSSPAVASIWALLTNTKAAPPVPTLKEQNPDRYKVRLSWGGYPPGFVKGPRPPGVSYDVAPAVPGDNVSAQQYVANGGAGPAGADSTGAGGVPTGVVISGTPRVPGTASVALGYVKDVVSADTVGTPGNYAPGNAAEYTVPVVSIAAAGASDSALSMGMIAALAVVGLVLVMGGVGGG